MFGTRVLGLAFLSASVLGSSAQAAVVFTKNLADSTGLHFDPNTTAQINEAIYLDVGQGDNNIIGLKSSTDILKTTPGSGEATLFSDDYQKGQGGTYTGGINQLTIFTASPNYLGFKGIELNLFGAAEDDAIKFTAIDGATNTSTTLTAKIKNGENRFAFGTDLGFISSLSFETQYGVALLGLDSVKQINIGMLTPAPQPNTQPVPGPIAGAGLPVLAALGGFIWRRRRHTPAA